MIPKGYERLELRDLQMLQLDVMKKIHQVCVDEGITYYLIAGSLLGAVRHGGFIPWDDDIDIAMMRPDYERFKTEFDSHFDKDKYFLQNYSTDKYFQPALMRLCIRNTYVDIKSQENWKNCKNTYIDIFPLDNVPDTEDERFRQFKDLSNVDKAMARKYYRIYPENGFIKRMVKRLISVAYSVVPLKYLQRMREIAMKRYSGVKTKAVSSTVSKYGYFRQIMNREIYGTPKLVKFEDTELFGPEKTQVYLKSLYGDNYMTLPPVEKRIKPQSVYIKHNEVDEQNKA